MELVGVHDEFLLGGGRDVVVDRDGQRLPQYVVPRDADAGMPGREAADLVGEAEVVQQFMPEYAVPDIVDRIEFTGRPVEAIDADIVQERAGPDQVSVDVEVSELLGDLADQ